MKSGIQLRSVRRMMAPALLLCLYAGWGVNGKAADSVFFLKHGKRIVPRISLDQQSYLPLVELSQALDLPYSESVSAGFFQINVGNNVIKLTRGRSLAALNEQAVALPAPVVYSSAGWLVHPDFIIRILNRVLPERLTPDNSGARFVQAGLNFIRLNVLDTVSVQGSRLTLQFSGSIDLEIRRETNRIVCSGGNVPIDPVKTDFPFKDPAISAITFEDLPEDNRLIIQLVDSRSSTRITRLAAQNIYLVEVSKPSITRPSEPPSLKRETAPVIEFPRHPQGLRILLDPGHGGRDLGIKFNETMYEKDLVLPLVRRIRTVLQNRLGAEVLETRNGDEDLTLNERCEIANRQRVDLVLSLHIGNSNQAMESKSRVYVYKPDDDTREETQNQKSLFVPWDQAQLKFLDGSRRLAELLQEEINHQLNGGDSTISFRQAPLHFLACLNMPSVLIEIGNSRRPELMNQIQEANFQEGLALAVLTAVEKYRRPPAPR